MTSLVLGASGFVGRSLVPALVEEGERVRAASRHSRDSRHSTEAEGETRSELVEPVVCDVRKPETLPAALRGVETVYYLVHSMSSGDHGDYRRVERASAENLAAAAEAAGCKRIVYLGGVAPRGAPSKHLASRLGVGEVLRSGGVPAIELRASMIIGNGSTSWQIVRDLGTRLPIMLLPRWSKSKSRPVALRDVVAALVAARRVPLERSAWFDVPGPEVLTARAMLERVGRLRGVSVPMVPVPVLTPRLSAMWLKLVTGADYAVAKELVLGLEKDLLPENDRFWDLIGHRGLTTFDEAAREALATEKAPPLGARVEEQIVQRMGRVVR
jgi:uncharacterized protein YbjT (DUF2867 family)